RGWAPRAWGDVLLRAVRLYPDVQLPRSPSPADCTERLELLRRAVGADLSRSPAGHSAHAAFAVLGPALRCIRQPATRHVFAIGIASGVRPGTRVPRVQSAGVEPLRRVVLLSVPAAVDSRADDRQPPSPGSRSAFGAGSVACHGCETVWRGEGVV